MQLMFLEDALLCVLLLEGLPGTVLLLLGKQRPLKYTGLLPAVSGALGSLLYSQNDGGC
jgi:hypothetical protein